MEPKVIVIQNKATFTVALTRYITVQFIISLFAYNIT